MAALRLAMPPAGHRVTAVKTRPAPKPRPVRKDHVAKASKPSRSSPKKKRPKPDAEAVPTISKDASKAPVVSKAPVEPVRNADSPEVIPQEPDPEEQIRRWAAQEWFARGQELADNSEEELEFYEKALEVDPHFAPAQYYVGVIQLEWGNRDAALTAFRRFLQDANEEERGIYPLPETVTSDELEVQEGGE